LLVPSIKKQATLLAVITNYVTLKMAPLPYIIGTLYNYGAINCTVHTCYVIYNDAAATCTTYAIRMPLLIAYILVIRYYDGATKCATYIRYTKT